MSINERQSGLKSSGGRFSLGLPPDWEDRTVYRYEGPEEDGVRHHITVTIEDQVDPPELQAYAQMHIKAVANELQAYQELKQGPLRLSSGLSAYEVVYKWCPVENREVYQRVVYALSDGTGYTLLATFSKKTWKTLGPIVDKILNTFTVVRG